MSFDNYRGKKLRIKSTDEECTIVDIHHKRGSSGLQVRVIAETATGKRYELMPHEYELLSQ